MKTLIKEALQNSGVRPLIKQSGQTTICTMVKNGYSLNCTISKDLVESVIRDSGNKIVDENKVNIKNSTDVKNALKEAVDFFKDAAENLPNLEESDPPEKKTPNETPESSNTLSVAGRLVELKKSVMELSAEFANLSNKLNESDSVNKSVITGFQANLYDLANDIEEFKTDLVDNVKE